MQETGTAPDAEAISWAVSPFVYHLTLIGLGDRGRDPLELRETRLAPVGRATAVEALRSRATAPRDGLR